MEKLGHYEDWGISSMSRPIKRISLLAYWTRSYVLTLLIGLLLVSLISALWIRHTTIEYRLDMMEFMADEMVYRLTNTDNSISEGITPPVGVDREHFRYREIEPIMYLVNMEGNIVSTNRHFPIRNPGMFQGQLEDNENTQIFTSTEDKQDYYVVKRKLEIGEKQIGWVLMVESKGRLTKIDREYGQLAILIITLGILGWGAIYFLSRRLSRPIKQVAVAAQKVQNGDYEINLPAHIKEKEVYELVSSFKEMTSRLEQLEKTRTELLAGVTHELKTPVTAINGLLQAIQDGVVTGKEAEDFLQLALKETTKMKTMVGDLLAFNSFAVDAVPVHLNSYPVNQMIQDAVLHWNVAHDREPKPKIDFLKHDIEVQADLVRVQQIISNLLTNAEQAASGPAAISLSIQEADSVVSVFIRDSGIGIPKEEQALIFERFFRGENKKYAIRGLGLGLSLSKMMAQSMGGDLFLVESSSEGTCFELQLKKVEEEK